jgi:hypothetical protein
MIVKKGLFSDHLGKVLLAVIALGAPAVGALTFQVTRNPRDALVFAIACMVIGFMAEVFRKLAPRWTDRVVEAIDAVVGATLSGIVELLMMHRRKYMRHIRFQHRDFDVKGLTTQGVFTLALEHVFVELSIAPQLPGKIPADPLRKLPEELKEGSHTIWTYLRSKPLQEQSLAIIGAPGSGKTTLLKHIALTLAAGPWRRRKVKAPAKLPILLFLRHHAEAIGKAIGGDDQKTGTQQLMDRSALRKAMAAEGFGESALRDVAFEFRVKYGGLEGDGKADKVDSLIVRCEEQGSYDALVAAYQKKAKELGLVKASQGVTSWDYTLVAAVQDALKRAKYPSIPGSWFGRQLRLGRCLVMLDGLDEIADPEARKQVVQWVEAQKLSYPKTRFIVTSRPFGYRGNPLSGVTVLEVRPFGKGQIERFVSNWYLANEVMSSQQRDRGVEIKAEEGAEDLRRRIWSTPSLSDLAVNPLLLTMIATVHRYRSSLPGRRVELYAEICEVFLGKRQAARGIEDDLTPAQKKSVLQPLAYRTMCDRRREIPLGEVEGIIKEPLARVDPSRTTGQFLRDVETRSGLLLQRESGVYGFAHKTFQEYLAAEYAKEKGLETFLVGQVDEDWWHETIRLYAAQADASGIVSACLEENPPTVAAFTLAIECMEEARDVAPEVRARFERVLETSAEDEDSERREIVAEALLTRRLRHMVRLHEDQYADHGLITHAEYQLFLDEQRAQENYYQPDHWVDIQFPRGEGTAPVVGVRYSDAHAFCEWLTEREAEVWHYRIPREGELDAATIAGSGAKYWVSSEDMRGIEGIEPFGGDVEDIVRGMWTADTDATAHDSVRTGARAFARVIPVDRASAFDLDSALVRARDSALDSDSAIAGNSSLNNNTAIIHDNARSFVRDLDNARDLDSAFDLDSALALDIALDIVLALSSARAKARDLVRDLDGVLKFDGTRAKTRDHDSILDLTKSISRARISAIARDIASDIDNVLASDTDSVLAGDTSGVLAVDSVLAIDSASTHARSIASNIASDVTSVSALLSARARASILARVSKDAGALDDALASALASAHGLVYSLVWVVVSDLVFTRFPVLGQIDFLRQFIRLDALGHVCALCAMEEGRSRLRRSEREAIRRLMDEYLGVYVDMCILEARIEGKLPAWEGIRIVKERVKEE